MRLLAAALGMFSVLPVGHQVAVDRSNAGRVIALLPTVGLVLGAIAGVVLWLVAAAGAPWVAAVAGVAVLAGLTGALHLDGVADTADGLGSRRPAEEALAVMKQSDIGPMGVITLLVVLALDVTALGTLAEFSPTVAALVLVAAATAGRLPVVWATRLASARPGGFGAIFAGATSPTLLVAATVGVVVLVAGAGWLAGDWSGAVEFVAVSLLALAVALVWARHLARRLGGMTGDTFGSLVEVAQAVVLVGVTLVWTATRLS